MDYRIEIVDKQNAADPLILHYAAKDSVSLNYLGGAEKDKVFVGAELLKTLETNDGADAKYKEYFTSDEKRFEVTKYVNDTNEVVFRGFLLPESYEEPYDYPTFYTKFSAVDGLGLLKGKLLADEYYSDEKTVIDIISACLKLTDIPFDIYLAPAIQNFTKKNWKDITLDTKKWYDEDKPISAYEILEKILGSMLCQIHQTESRWYIEGFQRRQMPKALFYKYDIDGNYLGTVEITKNKKRLNHFIVGAPSIKMVPALGRLSVSQKASELKVPETVYQDNDNPWVVSPGVDASFLPRDWNYDQNWLPAMGDPDNYLELKHNFSSTFNSYRKIDLRQKPYILKGTKVRINIEVQLINKQLSTAQHFQQNYDAGKFTNPQIYRVSLNDNEIFYNESTGTFPSERLSLDSKGKGEAQLDFVASENGYLNIELFQPYGDFTLFTSETYMQFKKITIKDLSQKENKVVNTVVDEKSSVTKEVELAISDDITANSLCWQLEEIRDLDLGNLEQLYFPIRYGFQLDGKYYSAVSLKAAVLIEQFPDEVTYSYLQPVPNPNVIYNFNGGSEMVVETGTLQPTGSFAINIRKYKDPETNRLNWIKWSDAVYGAEQKGYAEIVAEIYSRMFKTPHLQIVGSTDMPIRYNDLIQFEYDGKDRLFAVYDLQWNPDSNLTTFTLNECLYEGESVGNVPPFVYAGPDIVLPDGSTSVQVTEALVSDSEGEVNDLQWTQISGPSTAVFSNANALNPAISNLVAGEYVFRLTGTDQFGASAFDEMRVYTSQTYLVTMQLGSEVTTGNNPKKETKTYFLNVNPAIPAGSVLNVYWDAYVKVESDTSVIASAVVRVFKNGSMVFQIGKPIDNNELRSEYYPGADEIPLLAGDELKVELSLEYYSNYKGKVNLYLYVGRAEFTTGDDAVVNAAGLAVKTFQK